MPQWNLVRIPALATKFFQKNEISFLSVETKLIVKSANLSKSGGIVEKLKGTKRIYLHYARNQCPNKGNAVIEREKFKLPKRQFQEILYFE